MKGNNRKTVSDDMLKRYYSVGINEDFKVDREYIPKSRASKTKVNIIRYTAIAACVVLVSALLLVLYKPFDNINVNKTPETSAQIKDNGTLIIKTYAAEVSNDKKRYTQKQLTNQDMVSLGGVYFTDELVYFNTDGYYYKRQTITPYNKPYIESSNDDGYSEVFHDIEVYHIALDIEGDNVKSFDISAKRGNFNYSEFNYEFEQEMDDFEITPEIVSMIIDNEHMDESFDYENTAENIEYSDKKSLFWYPDIKALLRAIDEYATNTRGVNREGTYTDCSIEYYKKFYSAQDEFFSKHTLNEFVGDTITITVHYNDGKTETIKIDVSLNKDGDFVIKYK